MYKNGKVFIGDFIKDQKHGQGILLDKDGSILYEGEYVNDKMHGKGKIFISGKYFYEGEFDNNKMEGKKKY